MSESTLIRHEACPHCTSSDANALYSDGSHYCFSCQTYTKGESSAESTAPEFTSTDRKFLRAEPQHLTKRGLSYEDCKKWGYGVSEYLGSPVQVAPFTNIQGRVVAQKIRFPDKTFKIIGDMKDACLFGQSRCQDAGKMLIITEGELDAMSVEVALPNWPVVSIKNGASGAKRDIQKQIEWIERFSSVVFLFDQDEVGQKAAKECAELLTPGKAKLATIPCKDANEMLQQGLVKQLSQAIWGSKPFRPDGLVQIEDLIDDISKPVEKGLPWFIQSLTDITFGRRPCELYAFGAGTGIGKTDFLTQQIAYDITELKQKVGVFFLEQLPTESAKRIAGKVEGRRFHVPDGSWEPEELVDSVRKLSGSITFYNSFGQTDWDIIKNKLRYMAHAEGIQLFYIDHLTAMADTSDEKGSLEQIMKEMAGIANELKVIIHFVSHLATPDGKPHEEGGQVSIRHFKGSRAIGFWSYFMFGLERNQQDADEKVRQTTRLRVLKDRYTGQATGHLMYLGYEPNSTRLFETDDPFTEEVTTIEEDF